MTRARPTTTRRSLRWRGAFAFALLALASCSNGTVAIGSIELVSVGEYSGRCGDPPHGTAYRVLDWCQVMHDDPPSGGGWRFWCD